MSKMAYIFFGSKAEKIFYINTELGYEREVSFVNIHGTILERVGVLERWGELSLEKKKGDGVGILEFSDRDVMKMRIYQLIPIILIDDNRNVFYMKDRGEGDVEILDEIIYKIFGDGYDAGISLLTKIK